MAEQPDPKALEAVLFARENASVYAVLDGASVPKLRAHLREFKLQHYCLYSGKLAPDIAQVAPYLLQLERGTPGLAWILKEGWGKHWGIFAAATADLRTMRRHFRQFLLVKDPDGKTIYFRFYDPRVFRIYLPTCNGQERKLIFGPVHTFVAEDADPLALLRFETTVGSVGQLRLELKASSRAAASRLGGG